MATTADASLARSFAAGFAGSIITPDDPGYDTARPLWNATVNGHPALTARCHFTADVVVAVKLTRTAGVPPSRAGPRSPARGYRRIRVTAAACSAWRAWSQSPVQ